MTFISLCFLTVVKMRAAAFHSYCSASPTTMDHGLKLWATMHPSLSSGFCCIFVTAVGQVAIIPATIQNNWSIVCIQPNKWFGTVTRRPHLTVTPEGCRWNCPAYPLMGVLVRTCMRKNTLKILCQYPALEKTNI